MIQGLPEAELERRMLPGEWAPEGYLAPGQSLASVLAADQAVLNQMQVTAGEIAAKLAPLLKAVDHQRGVLPVWAGRFLLWRTTTAGLRTCPWAAEPFTRCQAGEGEPALSADRFWIINLRRWGVLRGNTASLHLIRDHGFFGGPGTPYRVDPALAVRILETERI